MAAVSGPAIGGAMSDIVIGSCGVLPWGCAGLRGLAAQEGLNDDHRTSAFGAKQMYERIVGIVTVHFNWRLAWFRFRIKQASDRLYPFPPDAIGEEARVPDAMEPRR